MSPSGELNKFKLILFVVNSILLIIKPNKLLISDDIDRIIRPILDDKADCVFGSRFLGGLQYKMPFHRALGNRFFSWVTSKLTGLKVTDGQTGLMAFGKRYICNFEIIADYNETQQLIIDSWCRHMRVIEVPVVFHKRETGKSFISWRYPFKVLPTIIRLFVHINPLIVFMPISILFIVLSILRSIRDILLFNGIGTAAVLLFMIGLQTFFFGLVADLIVKKIKQIYLSIFLILSNAVLISSLDAAKLNLT